MIFSDCRAVDEKAEAYTREESESCFAQSSSCSQHLTNRKELAEGVRIAVLMITQILGDITQV